jgi:hypothetical protein
MVPKKISGLANGNGLHFSRTPRVYNIMLGPIAMGIIRTHIRVCFETYQIPFTRTVPELCQNLKRQKKHLQ